jgi:hypothetical protein
VFEGAIETIRRTPGTAPTRLVRQPSTRIPGLSQTPAPTPPSHGPSPVPTHNPRTAQPVPRAITSARKSEALFGGNDLHTHAPLATFRDRPRTHAWAKPCLAGPPGAPTAHNVSRRNRGLPVGEALFGGPTYNAVPASHVPRATPNSTHGRSPVWRADPRRSYERSVASRTPRVAARLGWSFLITP